MNHDRLGRHAAVKSSAKTGDANPLDALLQRLAERSPSERVRGWAAGLLARGEVATSGADTAVNPQREARRKVRAKAIT
jgi:hypothetical protein